MLYLHPAGHLNDLTIPAGAIACLNALNVRKAGRYAFEASETEIGSARLVAVDLHWAIASAGFAGLIRHVRSIRPDVPIIAGGITAGLLADSILHHLPVDYVVRGDSETAFAVLVDALLGGRSPEKIPNILSKDSPHPPLRRMTKEEFDRSDNLTIDWFPTFRRYTDWPAAAFSQSRFVPLARGCMMRCPDCYGSHASTFGPGVIERSPDAVVRVVRQAEAERVSNLHLFLGRITAERLSGLAALLADSGPFRFGSDVCLQLCTPPSGQDLERLLAAFEGRIAFSFVVPAEYAPPLPMDRVREEMERWRRAVRLARPGGRLSIDAWTARHRSLARLVTELGISGSVPAKVSYSGTWDSIRPLDGGSGASLETLLDVTRSVWTFFGARLLSPPLASALTPFRYLDELDGDPEDRHAPDGIAADFWPGIMQAWRDHRLPLLFDLEFVPVPIVLPPRPLIRQAAGTRWDGDAGVLEGGSINTGGPAGSPLSAVFDHRGVRLTGRLECDGAGVGGLALIPVRRGTDDRADRIARGVAEDTLVLPTGPPVAKHRLFEVQIVLLVNQARMLVTDRSGRPLSSGRADCGFLLPLANPSIRRSANPAGGQ